MERYQRGKFKDSGFVKMVFEASHQVGIHPGSSHSDGDSVSQRCLGELIKQQRGFKLATITPPLIGK
ncbi:MAG: hypothetical protein Q7T21_00850 [Gallionella sp.]|nr:hypothetical protein [Gallionella sp.]